MKNTNLCPQCSEELEVCENCEKDVCLDCDKGSEQDDEGQCFCPDCAKAMNVKSTKTVNVRFTVDFSEDMEFTQAEWDILETAIEDGHTYIKEHSKAFDLVMDAIRAEPLEWVNEIEVDINEE